jgi:DNA-binding LacI/PurR family transcriptional regulator
MRDVATAANVSIQTVSNVINHRAHEMSPETLKRVEEVLTRLGYHPNQHARTLRSHRSRTLGFLILDPETRFLADPMTDMIVAGIGDVTRERGYAMLIRAGRPEPRATALFDPVHEQRVDGLFLLLSGSKTLRRWYVRQALALETPLVLFEAGLARGASCVTAANRQGGEELTNHLLDRGHRRIAFIGTEMPWPMVEERHAGYRAALERRGIAPDPTLELFRGAWTAANGAELARSLLARKKPPTAIMAGNDLLALGALQAVRDAGGSVPDDVAITGFNDFEFADFTVPRLTTVRIPGYEMGAMAAAHLIDKLEGTAANGSLSETLPVELLVRDSS